MVNYIGFRKIKVYSFRVKKKLKLISYSETDPAGVNIVKILVDEFGFSESGDRFNDLPVYGKGDVRIKGFKKSFRDASPQDFAALTEKPEVCIVASRHKSESGKPTLTCHATGNFGRAEMGGADGKLAVAPALYLREALLLLKEKWKKYSLLDYDVSLEVTHHGPSDIGFPLLFMEVGSSEEQWRDMNACKAVAEAIRDLASKEPERREVGVGFGGPHYAPNFTEIAENLALGHIASKYALEFLDKDLIGQMVLKTIPKPDYAVLDWKGFKSEERKKVLDLLNDAGLGWRKTNEFKKDG